MVFNIEQCEKQNNGKKWFKWLQCAGVITSDIFLMWFKHEKFTIFYSCVYLKKKSNNFLIQVYMSKSSFNSTNHYEKLRLKFNVVKMWM